METDTVTGKDAQDMHSEAQAADALRKLKAENRNLAKRKELILKAEAARNQYIYLFFISIYLLFLFFLSPYRALAIHE